MSAKFQLKKAKNGKVYFNLRATNGEIILTSQMYASKATAKKGIAAVQTNAADTAQYDVKQNRTGKYYFVLKAKNHLVIGTSESYSSEAAMKNGLKSVSKNGPKAKVEDLT